MTPQELFDQNKGLVYHILFKWKYPPEAEEDLKQVGMLALWKAALGYDPDNGAAFTTYAGRAIERAYNDACQDAWNSSGLSVSGWTRSKAVKAFNGNGEMLPEYSRLFQTALSTEYQYYRENKDDDLTVGDMLLVEEDHTDLYRDDLRSVLLAAVDRLNKTDRLIISMRYGLNGYTPMSRSEIAAELKVSEFTVTKWTRKALDRLAGIVPSSLRDYLK